MFDASAIEQVLLLAKNARGPASVVDLISGALARPDLFVFGELLDLAAIRQLRDEPEVQPWYAALELFAYGTWSDFTDHPESFPNLSDLQKRKLKQLTAVTTVQGQKITTYTTLKANLGFEDVRDLEDFLINHCFYAGVVQGRIDQEKGLVVVSGSIKRDVQVQDFSELKSKLESWVSASERCLEDVLNRIVFTREAVEKTQAKKEQLLTESEKRMQEIKDSDDMIIDEQFAVIRGGLSMNDDRREFKTRRANQYP